jgi:hypothetical protein
LGIRCSEDRLDGQRAAKSSYEVGDYGHASDAELLKSADKLIAAGYRCGDAVDLPGVPLSRALLAPRLCQQPSYCTGLSGIPPTPENHHPLAFNPRPQRHNDGLSPSHWIRIGF